MRRLPRCLSLAAAALCAAPARAAEAGAQAGLPQFDVALFPAQLFWLVVNFGVLYILMAFVALPRIQRAQKKRSDAVAAELTAATAASDAAKTMIAHYEKALADARATAQQEVNSLTAEAAKHAAEQQAVQQRQLAKRLQEAEAKIAAARTAALGNARGVASELAAAVLEKITGSRARA